MRNNLCGLFLVFPCKCLFAPTREMCLTLNYTSLWEIEESGIEVNNPVVPSSLYFQKKGICVSTLGLMSSTGPILLAYGSTWAPVVIFSPHQNTLNSSIQQKYNMTHICGSDICNLNCLVATFKKKR